MEGIMVCDTVWDELEKGSYEHEVFEATLEALTNMYATKLCLANDGEEQ